MRPEQDNAAKAMLEHDNGVLDAATAFGKTVVCSYLIAKRGVSTLILLRNKGLLEQWINSLEQFLIVDEKPPAYTTPTGKLKYRETPIGTYLSGQDKTTGIIDIAMIGSICDKFDDNNELNSYGMVIFDECHGAASAQAQKVLAKTNARYVYGVTATPERSDELEKIIFMMIGPIRHSYTVKELAETTGIEQYVYPRFTRVVNPYGQELDINKAYKLVSSSQTRNTQILMDIRDCISQGRSPVVLTRFKKHAAYLASQLQGEANHVYLLYGDNTDKANRQIQIELEQIPASESIILIATGSKIGEGFNLPRLDTLMLVSPTRFEGRIIQYAGRIGREYPGKKTAIVFDYVDSHIGYFDYQYKQRLKAYAQMQYKIMSPEMSSQKQMVNSIFCSDNYGDIFERDIIEAENEIIIASPYLTTEKIERFLKIIKVRQEAGVRVTVVTMDPLQHSIFEEAIHEMLIMEMEKAGIIVLKTADEGDHFAIFDKKLIWHGGMNLLGKEDSWENMIRTIDEKAAEELMEMSMVTKKV